MNGNKAGQSQLFLASWLEPEVAGKLFRLSAD
jgi:hypothetical protein